MTAEVHPIVGTWSLRSFTERDIKTDAISFPMGSSPRAAVVYTADGHVATIFTATGRRAPAEPRASEAEAAQLYRSMVAFAGRYEIHDNELIYHPEISWNEAWNGTRQVRYFEMSDGLLRIRSAPAASTLLNALTDMNMPWSGVMSTSKRRSLLGLGMAGGLILAAPVASVLARETKKPGADEAAAPPEQLMRGHAILARVLLIYENGLRRAGQGEDIDPAVFTRAAEITKRFIHDHQEKVEEELVFAQFKKAGRMVELVGVLTSQHAAGAKVTDKILAAAPQARNKEPREAMARDVQALVAMYRPHMAREATDVFPTLRHLVTADEYAEIADEMMKRERQAVGADGFEKVAKQVAEVEQVIGIQDIGVFTPKS
jgi:hemerythrin-like domain-containing protein